MSSFKYSSVTCWSKVCIPYCSRPFSIWSLIAAVFSGVGLIHWATLEQKNLAIEQSKDFAMSVHQMTLAGLTGMMITGTIGLRSIFLDQIK